MYGKDKMNGIQKLAYDINSFWARLDGQGYAEQYGTAVPTEEGYQDILSMLKNGKTPIVKAWLTGDYDLDKSMEKERKRLLAQINKLEKASEKKSGANAKKMAGILSRNVKKRPVDELMDDRRWKGTFLFDDGTIGYIMDMVGGYEPTDFLDDPDYVDVNDHSVKEVIDDVLYIDGKRVLGSLYIDRYDLNGEFYQGDAFVYYAGETVKDYCDRNGEPYPIKELPDFLYELCENDEFDKVRRYLEKQE